jgi:hypothetical protein
MNRPIRSAVLSRSPLRRGIIALWALLFGLPSVRLGQASAEAEVKAVVERFLAAAGRQDLDALPALFAPGASIGNAAPRKGRWVTRSQSFDAWLVRGG